VFRAAVQSCATPLNADPLDGRQGDALGYGYILMRAVSDAPLDEWPSEEPPLLGSVSDIQRKLSDLCPHIVWDGNHTRNYSGCDCCGQFMLSPDSADQVSTIHVAHIHRRHVERIARSLGIIAIDSQKVELIRP